jgi:hypothetical protein
VDGQDGAAVADSLQQQQQQQLMSVCIGGQPPVSGPLLAAVRVMLGQVRHWEMGIVQSSGCRAIQGPR